MIESKQEVSKDKSTSGLEKTLQALEQAKQCVANEKKKQNEKHSFLHGSLSVRNILCRALRPAV